MALREEYRILIVDDDETSRLIMAEFLDAYGGITCDLAVDGWQALEFIYAHAYDLIFMDISMPKMDGEEVIRLVRASKEEHASTPIVVVTANALEGHKEKYLSCGADRFMPKPVTFEQIHAISRAMLRKQNKIHYLNPSQSQQA